MSLSIVNNSATLASQANFGGTTSVLDMSLQRLSTGLKINRGADGPAALVISEQQRARIAGLTAAINNTNAAVSMVQTGAGALNEIGSLLTSMRAIALDSSSDPTAVAASQAELQNTIATIGTIAQTTRYADTPLFAKATASGPASTAQVIAAYAAQSTDDIADLAKIDLAAPDGAKNAVTLIDSTISDVANAQHDLGLYRAGVLQAHADTLQASLQNTTQAEPVVRDTDFASEIANFTRQQMMLAAGATVLGKANQIPSLIASLLHG